MITSLSNPKVKYVKSLGLRKYREKEKKFVVEGIHLVSEALKASREQGQFKIDFALFSKRITTSKEGKALLADLSSAGVETLEISDKLMSKLSEVETPQGVLAVVNMGEGILDELCSGKNPLIAVCVGIQDPGNMGTIIRTADATGATGIVTSKGSVDMYNAKTVRSSMGSIFHLPIVCLDDIKVGIKRIHEKGIQLVATTPRAKSDFWDIEYSSSVAIVLGSEASGLPEELLNLCDHHVKIPMVGEAESLNVGVAASILFYEALRQRTKGA